MGTPPTVNRAPGSDHSSETIEIDGSIFGEKEDNEIDHFVFDQRKESEPYDSLSNDQTVLNLLEKFFSDNTELCHFRDKGFLLEKKVQEFSARTNDGLYREIHSKFLEGEKLFQANKLEEATRLFQLYTDTSEYPLVYNALGLIHFRLHRIDQAIKALKKSGQAGYAVSWNNLGNVMLSMDNLEKAKKYFLFGSALLNEQSLLNLGGVCCHHLFNYHLAELVFEFAAQLTDSFTAHYKFSLFLMNTLHRGLQAQKHVEPALEKEPDNTSALCIMGKFLENRGMLSPALDFYKKAGVGAECHIIRIKKEKDFQKNAFRLFFENQFLEAEKNFLRAIKKESTQAMNNLGTMLCSFPFRLHDAKSLFLRSARLGNHLSMYSLGRYYLKHEREYSKAENWYRAAVTHGYSPALVSLGEVIIKLDNSLRLEVEQCFLEAAQQGYYDALISLGLLHHHIFGLNTNAEYYLKLAIQHGKDQAGHFLVELYRDMWGSFLQNLDNVENIIPLFEPCFQKNESLKKYLNNECSLLPPETTSSIIHNIQTTLFSFLHPKIKDFCNHAMETKNIEALYSYFHICLDNSDYSSSIIILSRYVN